MWALVICAMTWRIMLKVEMVQGEAELLTFLIQDRFFYKHNETYKVEITVSTSFYI